YPWQDNSQSSIGNDQLSILERSSYDLRGLLLRHCFERTFCPSFKSAGGLTIKSSPPIRPFEIVAPCCDLAATCVWRRTPFPSPMMKTAPSRSALGGMRMSDFAAVVCPAGPGFSEE